MSQPAANMQKAMEAMEKAQTTETRQIVIVPTYSMRFILCMSVAAMMVITLFPVLVIRLVIASSELSPFHSTQSHGAASLPVNVTETPAWTHQGADTTALTKKQEVTGPAQSFTSVGSSEVPTASTSVPAPAAAKTVKTSVGVADTGVRPESDSALSDTVSVKPNEFQHIGAVVKRSLLLKKLSV